MYSAVLPVTLQVPAEQAIVVPGVVVVPPVGNTFDAITDAQKNA